MTDPSPWLRFYGDVKATLEYPGGTLHEAIAKTADRVPDAIAWDFQGTTSSYRTFLDEVDRASSSVSIA